MKWLSPLSRTGHISCPLCRRRVLGSSSNQDPPISIPSNRVAERVSGVEEVGDRRISNHESLQIPQGFHELDDRLRETVDHLRARAVSQQRRRPDRDMGSNDEPMRPILDSSRATSRSTQAGNQGTEDNIDQVTPPRGNNDQPMLCGKRLFSRGNMLVVAVYSLGFGCLAGFCLRKR